ncbi:MAG: hypothetical protein A4E20_11095 [Nitrospira sp. SG-bin2]|nr:MAG: hypothetical protein A4E20_11095 [Nitrospira sp. SG-bin2]
MIGAIRVRENEDSYNRVIYVQIGQDTYRAFYVNFNSGEVMEGFVSGKSANRWPIVWEPK